MLTRKGTPSPPQPFADGDNNGANGSDPERDEVEANENNVEEDKEVSVDVRLRKADFL